MVRVPTALLVLFSIVGTPLASMGCMARCDFSLMHQHSLCREKAHDYMGPHVHHMNHVHMLNQDTEPALSALHEQSRHLAASWDCPNGSCATISIALTRKATVRASDPKASSYVRAVIVSDSPPVSSQIFSNITDPISDTSPGSISAPLRI